MHQSGHGGQRRRDSAGDEIVGDAQQGQLLEPADVGGESAGDAVSGEVDDAKEREGGDATGNLAGDSLPVGYGDAGELSQLADLRRDLTSHVAGAVWFLHGGVDGTGAEVDFGDSARVLVAGDAEPVAAAIGAGP